MLHTFHRGDGERPVVLLHGFLGSGRNLASLAREWTARDPTLRAIVPDLPGHGESPALPEGADLSTMGRAILELIAAEAGDGSAVTVVGHSLGGRVALQAAAMASSIDAVVLLDIAPGPVPSHAGPGEVVDILRSLPDTAASRAEMIEHMESAGISGALTDWLAMNLQRSGDEYVWRIDREGLADFHRRTTIVDLWPLVEHSHSALRRCIRGGRSSFVGDKDVLRLERAGCRVDTLPDAGHFLHVEALDDLLDVLVDDDG